MEMPRNTRYKSVTIVVSPNLLAIMDQFDEEVPGMSCSTVLISSAYHRIKYGGDVARCISRFAGDQDPDL